MTPELDATLKNLPDRPGVYLMKDTRGNVIYVGKAQSLRSRVRSYWQKEAPGIEHHLIRSVIDRVVDVEYTLTDSVGEALLLEGNLVKRFQPQFNVRLKEWEDFYNFHRPHGALEGQMPYERLREKTRGSV